MSDPAIDISFRKVGRGSSRMSQTQLKPQFPFVLLLTTMSLGGLWYLANRGGAELPVMTPAVAQTPAVGQPQEASAPEPAGLAPPPESPLWDVTATRNTGMKGLFAQLESGAESQKGDASIAGIVVDKQGNPMSGMKIFNGGPRFIMNQLLSETVSGADGSFLLRELPAGEFAIMAIPAQSGGMGIDTGIQTFTLKPGQSMTGVRLIYEGASERTISGRVTGPGGEAVDGARVEGSDSTASRPFSAFTETDDTGHFVLETRSGKRCWVSVIHPDYTAAHFTQLEAGQNDLDIVLKGRGTIRGQVVDAVTGKPVTQFEAGSGVRWGSTMRGVRSLDYQPFDVVDGQFTLTSVEVGEVNVYLRAPGYAPTRLELPELQGDTVTELGPVRLLAGASLEGTVVDMAGKPVPDARILLGGTHDRAIYPGARTSQFSGEEFDAITDGEGRFFIDSLSPELVEITLTHPDHARTVGPLSLSLGQKSVMQLVMTGFATVEGTVYVNGEKSGAGNRVHTQNDSMTVSRSAGPVSRSAETDAQGFYRMEELPAGVMLVQVGTQEGGSMRHAKAEATTVLGHTTVIDLYVEYGTATISGKVIWDGEAVPNVSVSASLVGGGDYASGMVSPDSTYKITGLNGGEYRVYVADVLSGKPKILGIVKTTVAAGEMATADIECGEK